ncbi:hypothetical protein BpHYR1_026678 [Brachionus plicatilis]|uniref:Uncharacterized protein n=1 Tax=Brachionus plicatilis TaxID=10195 RepID=A0A3M7Q219_BRAPC|nr:hypothetical protein BpHYR1_026678 [Brachionus plicatilis]
MNFFYDFCASMATQENNQELEYTKIFLLTHYSQLSGKDQNNEPRQRKNLKMKMIELNQDLKVLIDFSRLRQDPFRNNRMRKKLIKNWFKKWIF